MTADYRRGYADGTCMVIDLLRKLVPSAHQADLDKVIEGVRKIQDRFEAEDLRKFQEAEARRVTRAVPLLGILTPEEAAHRNARRWWNHEPGCRCETCKVHA